ncbi:hypothetical protein C0995_007168 [Termitomyces sp. Mi166|nr:hypothetical protein C0995_007168 [Termitomyces sp. Mi166\
MAPHALNVSIGPHKTQNIAIAKSHCPSPSMEPVATTPPDNYGLLKHSCRHDNNHVIVGVFLYPSFAQALIGLLFLAKVFPSTGADQAYFLGTLQLEPKPKTIKASTAAVNHQSGSTAILVLLGKVDATLKAIQLAEDGAIVPCPELQKHCDAVNLAPQQQLYSLDISLQTFKMILERLDCLNQALGSSDIDQTSAQF